MDLPDIIEPEDLAAAIEQHCADVGMKLSVFGKRVVNDGKLIKRLRAGRPVEMGTLRKIRDAMRSGDAPHD